MNTSYVYIYLNPLITGFWNYKTFVFNQQPFYVGIGVDKRWKIHLNPNRQKYENNTFKHDILNTLHNQKISPVILKLYENISSKKAKQIEIDIIKKFGRKISHNGILTNITKGGDSTNANCLGSKNIHRKKVFQYKLNGKFIKEWDCGVREIGRTLKVSYNSIADCCRNKSRTSYGYQWSYTYKGLLIDKVKVNCLKLIYKKVYKFNIKGKLLKQYESVTEAAIKNKTKKDIISRSCRKKGKHKKWYFRFTNNFQK